MFLQNRADVFTNLLESGDVTNVTVDTTQTEKLLRLLDTVVIRLEGGTDEDLKVLDEKPVEPKLFEQKFEPPRSTTVSKGIDEEAAVPKPTGRPNNPFAKNIDDVGVTKFDNDFKTSKAVASSKSAKNDDDEDWDAESDDGKNEMSDKKKQDDDDDWIEDNKNESGSKAWDDEPASPDQKDQISSPEANDKHMDWDESHSKAVTNEIAEVQESNPRKRSRSVSSSSSSSSSDSDATSPKPIQPRNVSVEEEVNEPKDEEIKSAEATDLSEPVKDPEISDEKISTDLENKADGDDVHKDDSKVEDKVETIDLDKESDTKEEEGPTHKALHRTSSIFLRNLAPTITKAEVEAMCKRYNGFLRVAIADPLVERRWFRRGWVTFERNVNIKEICWNLNNIRLRDCELGAIVSKFRTRLLTQSIDFVFFSFFLSYSGEPGSQSTSSSSQWNHCA